MKPLLVSLFGLLALAGCSNHPGTLVIEREQTPIILLDVVNFDVTETDMGSNPSTDLGSSEPDLDEEDQAPDLGPPRPLEDIAIELANLPNVVNVEELGLSRDGERRFYVDFLQPLDHFSEGGPTFVHRGIFYFRDYDAPTVLMTTGYGVPELEYVENLPVGSTDILQANQLSLGHRFFTGAIPEFENQDWTHVNIRQAAEDNHKIITSMRSILRQNWIGTGWSKGGMTIIFQEFFHPEDLDLAIPKVAPISFSLSDQRYPPFLANIGTEDCRNRLDSAMFGALNRTTELAGIFGPQNDAELAQYSAQIKYAVIAYPWSFWQYYGINFCGNIPLSNASAQALVTFFVYNELPKLDVPNNEPRPIRDEEANIIAYIYQGLQHLGFQDANGAGQLQRFVDLGYLTAGEKAAIENPDYSLGDYPWDVTPTYDPQPMIEVDTWLKSEARDMIAIYGEYDPWTAGKITLNPANNSQLYIAPGGSHGTFLTDLTAADFNLVRDRILSFDNRQRARSFNNRPVQPKATPAQREILRKLLRQDR